MNALYDFIISINDRIDEALKKHLDRFIGFCEPYWNLLVKTINTLDIKLEGVRYVFSIRK